MLRILLLYVRRLAGSAALHNFVQNSFLVYGSVDQLLIHIVETQTGDGIRKPLPGDALIPEQQNGLFNYIHDFFFSGGQLGQRRTVCNLLAPAAANVDLVAVLVFFQSAKGALAFAAATVVAHIGINVDLAVHDLSNLDGAVVLDLAILAATALGEVHHGNALSDDAKIIQIGFHTVIGTSSNGNLELMGQGDAMVTHVEPFVNLFAQIEGINQTVLAGCSLAGDHGANQTAGAAGG